MPVRIKHPCGVDLHAGVEQAGVAVLASDNHPDDPLDGKLGGDVK